MFVFAVLCHCLSEIYREMISSDGWLVCGPNWFVLSMKIVQ